MNELIHAALPFALRPAGGKACAFSVDEAGTLSLSGQARSDVLIDPSGERPEAGYLLGVPPRGGLIPRARRGPVQGTKICAALVTISATRFVERNGGYACGLPRPPDHAR